MSAHGRFGTFGAFGAFGAGEPAGSGPAGTTEAEGQTSADYTSLLSQYAPAITTVSSYLTDPARQVATYQAKLQTAIERGASAATIRDYQAKLQAATRALEIRGEGEAATRQWRLFGQVGVVAATGVALAIIYYLVRKAT